MQDLIKQDVLLTPSEIIVQMQSEMFKSNLGYDTKEVTEGLQAFKEITSDIQVASATGVLNAAKKLRKIGEDKRKEKTASLDNTKKMAIEAERQFFAELDTHIKAVSEAVLAFKQEQIRIANAKAQAIKEQAEKDAKRKRSIEGVARVQEAANQQLEEIAPVSGMRKTWQFEVESDFQVPREYLMIDEAKVKQAIKNGVREIGGIRIFEAYGLSGR